MTRVFLMTGLIVLLGLSLIPWHSNAIYVAIATGIIVAAFMILMDLMIQARHYLRVAWQSLWHWRQDIRISASYLFRIEVGGQYLLVRGHRFRQFQPIGGVYKTTERGTAALRRLGASADDFIALDEKRENDLRIRIKGRQLIPFLIWFESNKGRETDPWREFREELIATGHLLPNQFPYIYYEVLQRRINPLRFSEQAQCWELLIADIVDLIPNAEQMSALRSLRTSTHPDIRWVSSDTINRRTTDPGKPHSEPIAITASWTLEAEGS